MNAIILKNFNNQRQGYFINQTSIISERIQKEIGVPFADKNLLKIKPFFSSLTNESIAKNFINKITKEEPITIVEAKPFLEYAIHSLLHKKDSSLEEHWLDLAKKYYTETRQFGGFSALLHEIEKKALIDADSNVIENEKFIEMQTRVLNTIIAKADKQPAILGDKTELFSKEDYSLVAKLYQKTPPSSLVKQAYGLIQKAIKEAKTQILEILQNFNSDKNSYIDRVIKAKEGMRKISLNVCLHVNFELLEMVLEKKDLQKLKFIVSLSSHRGDTIDLALIKSWIEQHKSSKNLSRPKVVIEGGGPTGLLLAITQFCAGAEVTLFEKRSTQYSRNQIVKLDPKWVAELKFYLGSHFYDLFESPKRKGCLRNDGTADIAIKDLEDALHLTLSKLISTLESKKGEVSPIQRLAAHECEGISFKDGKFISSSKYIKNQDLGISEPKEKLKSQPVDILFCAGGKNSALKKAFLPTSVAITNSAYYGVCSWVSKEAFPEQNTEKMDLFPDFRGMFQVNDSVLKEFNKDLSYYTEDRVTKISRKNIQTRTFEAKGLVYIGMEIPEEVYKAIEKLPPTQRKHLENLWFQRVLISQGTKFKKITIDFMDKSSCSTFPLEQERLQKEHMLSNIHRGNQNLLVLAAGDALATPHFMFYSGLTGARETIAIYEKFTKSGATSKKDLQKELDQISNFILKRGSPLSTERSVEQIKQSLTEKIVDSLEDGVKKGLLRKNQTEYEVVESCATLKPMPGWIEDISTKKTYDSFAQFQIEQNLTLQ